MTPAQLIAHIEAESTRRAEVLDSRPSAREDRAAESCTVSACPCGVWVAVSRAGIRVLCSRCAGIETVRGQLEPVWMLPRRRR